MFNIWTMSVSFEEVQNFTKYVGDVLFGSSKCNKLQRIQFSCKRKQIIEKLCIFISKNELTLQKVFDIILDREGLFVYKCKRSTSPVQCEVSKELCHTYDEIHFSSQTSSLKLNVRTDITDVICKLHTFVHWQSFITCMLYTSAEIDDAKVYEQFCVLMNFINGLCTHK